MLLPSLPSPLPLFSLCSQWERRVRVECNSSRAAMQRLTKRSAIQCSSCFQLLLSLAAYLPLPRSFIRMLPGARDWHSRLTMQRAKATGSVNEYLRRLLSVQMTAATLQSGRCQSVALIHARVQTMHNETLNVGTHLITSHRLCSCNRPVLSPCRHPLLHCQRQIAASRSCWLVLAHPC
jgi:hypothetical protein